VTVRVGRAVGVTVRVLVIVAVGVTVGVFVTVGVTVVVLVLVGVPLGAFTRIFAVPVPQLLLSVVEAMYSAATQTYPTLLGSVAAAE
jgi:hypothetical protein